MIRKIISGVVCCIVFQANAQTSNTIVNANSSWATLNAVVCPECPLWTQYLYFNGDSIVAGYSYKKIFSCDDKLHENIKYEGLIREQNKKTYFIPANSVKEYLLYDFSLEKGMNFEYMETPEYPVSLYVKNVNFVEINGIQLKQIQLAEVSVPDYGAIRVTWIEKIGSLRGLFNPCGVLDPGAKRELFCYFQNNELVYKNPTYFECYYDKAEDIITSMQTLTIDDYNVYPNPVDDILTIFSSNNSISYIEIFDILGKKIYNHTYTDTIDVSSFPEGLYILKLYDANKQVSVFKIIKD